MCRHPRAAVLGVEPPSVATAAAPHGRAPPGAWMVDKTRPGPPGPLLCPAWRAGTRARQAAAQLPRPSWPVLSVLAAQIRAAAPITWPGWRARVPQSVPESGTTPSAAQLRAAPPTQAGAPGPPGSPIGENFSHERGHAVFRPCPSNFFAPGGGVSPYGAARARMVAHGRVPAPKRPGADVASRRKTLAKIHRFFAFSEAAASPTPAPPRVRDFNPAHTG